MGLCKDSIKLQTESVIINYIARDMQSYIHFKEMLYEITRFHFKENVFRKGSKLSIEKMKHFDKQTRFSEIKILEEYFYVLIVFKSWNAYCNKVDYLLTTN